MSEFEPLVSANAENVDAVVNGSTLDVGTVVDGETIDLGSVPVPVTVNDPSGSTSVTVGKNDTIDLNTSISYVTQDTYDTNGFEWMSEHEVDQLVDLSKGDYLYYDIEYNSYQEIILYDESDSTIESMSGVSRGYPYPNSNMAGRVFIPDRTPSYIGYMEDNDIDIELRVETKDAVVNSINIR